MTTSTTSDQLASLEAEVATLAVEVRELRAIADRLATVGK
jgi:hypothetical protein